MSGGEARGAEEAADLARVGKIIAAVVATMAAYCGAKPSRAATCSANASNISFGAIGVGALAGATSTGSIYEGCSSGWATHGTMTICNAIGAGSNSASQTARILTNGAYSISYNLYSNAAMTTPYADPGSDIFTIPISTAAGGYTTTTTYAKILSAPAGVAPGTYTDSYSSSSQGWASFDALLTPEITCGYNTQWSGAILSFTVSVTVLASCSISAGNMNFGSVSTLTAPIPGTAALSVTCTNTTPYTVSLGPGSGAGATTTNRSMTGTGGNVAYGLYQNAAHSVNWGNTPPPAANADTVSGVGTGAAQALTVYGLVPAQTTPPAGTYSDTVIVTVTY
jgi:spore coat protein U-like protein